MHTYTLEFSAFNNSDPLIFRKKEKKSRRVAIYLVRKHTAFSRAMGRFIKLDSFFSILIFFQKHSRIT